MTPILEMGKTEAQPDEVTCPGLPSQEVAEAGFKPELSDSRSPTPAPTQGPS